MSGKKFMHWSQHNSPCAPDLSDASQIFSAEAAGRSWELERPAELERLWEEMDGSDPEAEDHIPYWVELWPATLALCDALQARRQILYGAKCLDIGCGLGLSALIAASQGAQVLAMDFEFDALFFAARNAARNRVPRPLFTQMDWNLPALVPHGFDYIWGGDILYEERFFEPLEALLLRCLAPEGRVWLGDPERAVSRNAWARFLRRGWSVTIEDERVVATPEGRVTVYVRELRRQA